MPITRGRRQRTLDHFCSSALRLAGFPRAKAVADELCSSNSFFGPAFSPPSDCLWRFPRPFDDVLDTSASGARARFGGLNWSIMVAASHDASPLCSSLLLAKLASSPPRGGAAAVAWPRLCCGLLFLAEAAREAE